MHSVFKQLVTNRGGDGYYGEFLDFWEKSKSRNMFFLSIFLNRDHFCCILNFIFFSTSQVSLARNSHELSHFFL